jgi:hypothetical protein
LVDVVDHDNRTSGEVAPAPEGAGSPAPAPLAVAVTGLTPGTDIMDFHTVQWRLEGVSRPSPSWPRLLGRGTIFLLAIA